MNTTPYDPTDLSSCTLRDLLVGGDWAGAHGHSETLAAIARQLAAQSRPAERTEFEEVARLCTLDMLAGTALWASATSPLRGRCHRPGPRCDDPLPTP